jgi:hypothetical protein
MEKDAQPSIASHFVIDVVIEIVMDEADFGRKAGS